MSHLSSTFYALTLRLFDMLRQKEARATGRVVLISSARNEEGKTFMARAIAQYMADLSNDRVLLVDGNLDRPSLHQHYALKNGLGFSDCLVNGDFAGATVQDTAQANLKIMTVGQTRKPGLLFKPQSFAAFLQHFGSQFELILIDGGLLGASGCIPHQSDGIIMVVDASKTRREVIQGVMAQANVERSRYLGAILNKRMQYIPRALYRYF